MIKIVLEYPDRGGSAPNKYGTRYEPFLKTKVEGVDKPLHIYAGRVYDPSDPKDLKDFNEDCAKVVEHCHRRRMRVIPRLIDIEEKKEVVAPKKKVAKTRKKADRSPSLPPIISMA